MNGLVEGNRVTGFHTVDNSSPGFMILGIGGGGVPAGGSGQN
jgi:hypothetical protein